MTSPSPQPIRDVLAPNPGMSHPNPRTPATSLLSKIQHLTIEIHFATIACRKGVDLLHDSTISAHNAMLWYFDTQMEIALLLDPAPAAASPSETLSHLRRVARTLPPPPAARE